MSGLIIPTPRDLVNWRQRTALEGTDYLLDFAWNARMDRWVVSMLDASGEPLRTGIPIDVDVPLFYSPSEEMPKGVMTAIDTLGLKEPPTLDNLGSRVILKYYTQEQMAELVL